MGDAPLEGGYLSQDAQPEDIRPRGFTLRPFLVIICGKERDAKLADYRGRLPGFEIVEGIRRGRGHVLELLQRLDVTPATLVVHDEIAHGLGMLARHVRIRMRHAVLLRPWTPKENRTAHF